MTVFLGRLLGLARPYKLRLALGILFGVLGGLIEPLLMVTVGLAVGIVFQSPESLTGTHPGQATSLFGLPAFVQRLASQISTRLPQFHASASVALDVLVIAAIPLVMLVRGLFAYLNVYLLQWVAIRAVVDLRRKLFGHLLNLSLDFFHRASTGDLMSRIISDTAALHSAIGGSLAVMIKDPVTVLSLIAGLLYAFPRLTLLTSLVFPLCIIPIVIYSRKVRRSSAAIQTHFAEFANVMHESFTGNRIIKAYNLEHTVQRQFAEACRKFISHYMRVVRSQEIPGPLIEFLGALGVAFLFYYLKVLAPMRINTGEFIFFIGSVFSLYRPIKSLSRLHSQLEQARAASQRVFELLETQSQIREPVHPVPLRAAQAPIVFDAVSFAYGEKTVLKQIQLTVAPGQVVALVGASGSGKTTLTNLLLRFYDPQDGAIRIGDTDLRQVTTRDLRGQIAVVTQETILFNDTIRNNIALGRPEATEHEIVAAAKHAHAHEFILEKPQGYDTVIGEKGVILSGGQRQRLAIARALLKNAPILILDEATSALDTESERAVQAALEELMRGRTTLCIAHRLSTVQNADRIVVLDAGRIVETGKHAELIQRGGIYQKLYALQFQASP
ncbi:MAG: ABC transporter ATP-binding protein/permease [Verrucomicrobia bacterium]|nr:ABC transporter ATP-binding protein/permease [Verrucomicrobiota bacterium]